MAPNTLTTVALVVGFVCSAVVAGPVPYRLDDLDRSRYDMGTLSEIERRREGGESDVRFSLLFEFPHLPFSFESKP